MWRRAGRTRRAVTLWPDADGLSVAPGGPGGPSSGGKPCLLGLQHIQPGLRSACPLILLLIHLSSTGPEARPALSGLTPCPCHPPMASCPGPGSC